jgi:hypothetical protein
VSACSKALCRLRGDQLLFAGCGLGDTHVHPFQLKPLPFSFTTLKQNGFGTLSLQDASGECFSLSLYTCIYVYNLYMYYIKYGYRCRQRFDSGVSIGRGLGTDAGIGLSIDIDTGIRIGIGVGLGIRIELYT